MHTATATLAFTGIQLLILGNGSGLPANINAKNKGFPLEGLILQNMPITVLMVKLLLDLLVTQV
jgi:hypothetical protein